MAGLETSGSSMLSENPENDQNVSISSPLAPPSGTGTRKPKKPPPVTPKRFNRFFTPRSSSSRGQRLQSSKSTRRLQEITQSGLNRRASGRPRETRKVLFDTSQCTVNEDFSTPSVGPGKKRKELPSPASSPIQPSPSKRARAGIPVTPPFAIYEDEHHTDVETADESAGSDDSPPQAPPPRIRRAKVSGTNGRVLLRSFGGYSPNARGRLQGHCASWQHQTANFYTGPDDVHRYPQEALPFCTASCNTNSLVAIGDEDGGLRFLESAKDETPAFCEPHVSFKPHSNAVMDLAFSSDDWLLATASGDQTARVIDMRTQRTRYIMEGHSSSVKQVRFQPGNDNVIATSSRDGTVRLWDMRCSASEGAIREIQASSGFSSAGLSVGSPRKVKYAATYNTIADAHTDRQPLLPSNSNAHTTPVAAKDRRSMSEILSRRNAISITALSFLPAGREHLLLTASEVSTTVRLWDIRGRYSRSGAATPLSSTRQPESHAKHRQFGISSLALSGDGARFYALSRDSTVYAYSTTHLVLGHAPELAPGPARRLRYFGAAKEGLGPIYGFRHPRLHATTFYVKLSVRKPAADRPELLAAGSSDACAVLFPTDEACIKRGGRADRRHHDASDGDDTPANPSTPPLAGPRARRPTLRRSASGVGASLRLDDGIPIYEQGTPLARGHAKEVTAVSWTSRGELVTVGDDFTTRCWREGPQARNLRVKGEGEGRRWESGWAEVEKGFDDDDDDE